MARDSDSGPVPPDAELDEMLGAYALDAIDPDEREVIESYLERSPRARAEVNAHHEVASFLGNIGGEAPRALWERIEPLLLRGVAGADTTVAPPLRMTFADDPGDREPSMNRPPSGGDSISRPRSVRLKWWAGALAAAAAIVAVLGVTVARQNRRPNRVSQQSFQATRVNAILASKGAREAALDSIDGRIHVKVVIASNGEAYVLGSQLPTLLAGHTYQLWGVQGDKVLSLAILGRGFSVLPFTADEAWARLAITQEVAPGVISSTHQPVVAGQLV